MKKLFGTIAWMLFLYCIGSEAWAANPVPRDLTIAVQPVTYQGACPHYATLKGTFRADVPGVYAYKFYYIFHNPGSQGMVHIVSSETSMRDIQKTTGNLTVNQPGIYTVEKAVSIETAFSFQAAYVDVAFQVFESHSNAVRVSWQCTSPEPPAQFYGEVTSADTIKLSWSRSTGAQGYTILSYYENESSKPGSHDAGNNTFYLYHFNQPGKYIFRIYARGSGAQDLLSQIMPETLPKVVVNAQPPTAVTGAASEMTADSATLSGTVNPQGAHTMWHFEYAKPNAEWKKTDNAGIAVASDWPVTGKLFNLPPDTTYRYRITAKSVLGTTNGEEKTFRTAPLALADVTTGQAKNIGMHSATLEGIVNPHYTATSYWFAYGATTAYGKHSEGKTMLKGNENIPVADAINGLVPNTTYHYRIEANNAKGASYGEDKTFQTAAVSQAAVTQAAANIGQTSATLNGNIVLNGLAVTWWYEYGPTQNYGMKANGWEIPAGSSSNYSVPRNVTLLSANTTYHFRLATQSSAGVIYGEDKTFTTIAYNPPTATTSRATNITATSATLNASINPNGTATSYYFQYGLSQAYGVKIPMTPQSIGNGTSPVNVTANLKELTPNTTYHYRIIAVTTFGTAAGSDMTFKTAAAGSVPGSQPVLKPGKGGAPLKIGK